MKLPIILLVLLSKLLSANCQTSISPGGVKGAKKWFVTDTLGGKQGLRSRMAGDSTFLLLPDRSNLSMLNFNPALQFSKGTALNIPLYTEAFNSASFFTVYQCTDTSAENNIWHIIKDNQTNLVFTTSRMADLSAYQYMNYIDIDPGYARVNSYVQHKDKDIKTAKEQFWTLGSKPITPTLPITSFTGVIPEVIAYDMVLNWKERTQVATYLSIKYGITLTEPTATYLNSNGEKIWEGNNYPAFHHNIAGIGRDDASGLLQKRSASSNTASLLVISTKDSLNNNSFLLWGDNGASLTNDKKVAGVPTLLQKKWQTIPFHANTLTTNLTVDTRLLDIDLPAKPVYWLAIDRTGTGNFSLPGTAFVKMSRLEANSFAHFDNILWDADRSGKDVWSIAAAQDLLLFTHIDSPSCEAGAKGNLHVNILGGRYPCQLTIQDKQGNIIKQQSGNDTALTVTGVQPGKYFILVTDALGKYYADSFYVNNAGTSVPLSIADNYELPAGNRLILDAANQMPPGLQYQWTGPDNLHIEGAKIEIKQPGLYTLRCNKNGCISMQDIQITAPAASSIKQVIVYPNPSTGQFAVKIGLDKAADVSMSIYTSGGKLVSSVRGKNKSNYLFYHELNYSGSYEIVVQTGAVKVAKKLLIAK